VSEECLHAKISSEDFVTCEGCGFKVKDILATLQSSLDTAKDEIAALRLMLFYAHSGMQHIVYGDDGERQCNTCMIDFLRDTPKEMQEKIIRRNIDGLREAGA